MTPRLGRLGLLCGLLAVVLAVVVGFQLRAGSPALAPPPRESSSYASYASAFLPLVQDALRQGEALAALGISKDRNLLRIAQHQQATQAALAAADAWLAAHPPPAEATAAVMAYRSGADLLRAAMDEARTGLVSLDFARVAAATSTVQSSVATLRQAVALLMEDASPVPLPPP